MQIAAQQQQQQQVPQAGAGPPGVRRIQQRLIMRESSRGHSVDVYVQDGPDSDADLTCPRQEYALPDLRTPELADLFAAAYSQQMEREGWMQVEDEVQPNRAAGSSPANTAVTAAARPPPAGNMATSPALMGSPGVHMIGAQASHMAPRVGTMGYSGLVMGAAPAGMPVQSALQGPPVPGSPSMSAHRMPPPAAVLGRHLSQSHLGQKVMQVAD
eukprot:jgi/Mesen1/9666/ME000671S09006